MQETPEEKTPDSSKKTKTKSKSYLESFFKTGGVVLSALAISAQLASPLSAQPIQHIVPNEIQSCMVVPAADTRPANLTQLSHNVDVFLPILGHNPPPQLRALVNAPPSSTTNSFLSYREAGTCLHRNHNSYAQDLNVENRDVQTQRSAMVADFVGAALLRINTPREQIPQRANEVNLIQAARTIAPIGNNSDTASFSLDTRSAVKLGWDYAAGKTSQDIPSIVNQAREFALQNSFTAEHMVNLSAQMNTLKTRTSKLLDSVTERMADRPENFEPIRSALGFRYQFDAMRTLVPRGGQSSLGNIISSASTAFNSNLLNGQEHSALNKNSVLTSSLQQLELQHPTNLPYLRAARTFVEGGQTMRILNRMQEIGDASNPTEFMTDARSLSVSLKTVQRVPVALSANSRAEVATR